MYALEGAEFESGIGFAKKPVFGAEKPVFSPKSKIPEKCWKMSSPTFSTAQNTNIVVLNSSDS